MKERKTSRFSNHPAAGKQALRRTYDMDFEAVMQLEVDGVLECVASEDFVEGLRFFVEKRVPGFRER